MAPQYTQYISNDDWGYKKETTAHCFNLRAYRHYNLYSETELQLHFVANIRIVSAF